MLPTNTFYSMWINVLHIRRSCSTKSIRFMNVWHKLYYKMPKIGSPKTQRNHCSLWVVCCHQFHAVGSFFMSNRVCVFMFESIYVRIRNLMKEASYFAQHLQYKYTDFVIHCFVQFVPSTFLIWINILSIPTGSKSMHTVTMICYSME